VTQDPLLFVGIAARAVNAFKSSRMRRSLDALTGTVLVALGLRLAAERL
jgi:threonine/homoserine/homoserine lactone efflux protein